MKNCEFTDIYGTKGSAMSLRLTPKDSETYKDYVKIEISTFESITNL